MADRKAMIRIGARRDSSLRRTLRGVTDATQKLTRQAAVSSRKRGRAEIGADRAIQGSLKDVAREAERSAMRRLNSARRVASGKIRESRRATEAELRDYRRVAREQRKEAQKSGRGGRTVGGGGLAIGGLAAGAYAGAKGAISTAQSTLGVGTQESRLLAATEFETLLRTKGIEAGRTLAEIEPIRKRLLEIAKETLTDPLELVSGLATGQTRFDAFEKFLDQLPDLAKFSRATGSSMEDTIGMLGTLGDVFGIQSKEMGDALYYMAASSARGTISVKDFAGNLAGVLGEIRAATGRKGMAGLRETVAMLQMVGKGQAGAARTGTYTRALMSQLNETKVQKALQKIGVSVTEGGQIGGNLVGVDEIIKLLSENEKIQSAAVRQKIFTREEARAGLNFFMNAVKENPKSLATIQGASILTGQQLVQEQNESLLEGAMGRMREVGVNAQIKSIESMDKVADMNYLLANEITKLQTEFPILAKSLDVFEDSITGLLGGLIAGRLISGRLGGGTAVGGGSTTLAKTAVSKSPVASIAGALAVGSASFVITSAIIKATGADVWLEDLGSRIYDIFHPDEVVRKTNKRGLEPGPPIRQFPKAALEILERQEERKKEDAAQSAKRQKEAEALQIKITKSDLYRDPNKPFKIDLESADRIGAATAKHIATVRGTSYVEPAKRGANSPAR